ncbi:ABC transporter permease [Muricomes intestini]|jgi:simple sugar transport system permease protein|uniref:Nucleoside ABC transporter membrane protein n=1 Tax=Muricomes intestini TaxID=1796634 RepID=A0A4R3K330_9FIRM|nr:ABC transporter permease [Muricomes intestini]TCS77091.1 nucleoside ABC transporter membrane protein [Muricomes intestini]HAX51601.1 ABC transporter permease [Lachnospiraceae bacterium]HCR83756.1 ABC transporter permease [Lachnospiraceae bacterium]
MDKAAKILKKPFTMTLIAIFFGFLVAGIILAAAGYPTFHSLSVLLQGVFSGPKHISNVIIKSTPLILTGIGVAFAFQTGLFNIGAEGQFIMGCVAATTVGIVCDFPPVIQIPLVLAAGVLAGAVFGGMVGFLKAKFGIHEVLTSIMFNWIALYFSNFISDLKRFHKPDTMGTYAINKSGYTMILGSWKTTKEGKEVLVNNEFLRDTLLKTDVNAGILAAVVLAILVSFLLYKTTKGFELRAVGANRFAAESTGIDVNKNILHAMIISGGICGLAAAFYITGNSPHGIATLAAFENTGFNALGVCLIAASSPIGCIFAGLLFGGLLYGGQSLQYEVGAPSEIINIVIGVVVFFVALTHIIPPLVDRFSKGGKNHAK